jgi:hypothetical protein
MWNKFAFLFLREDGVSFLQVTCVLCGVSCAIGVACGALKLLGLNGAVP